MAEASTNHAFTGDDHPARRNASGSAGTGETSAAGSPSAGFFGLTMNAQNSEAAFSQVVQTLGYQNNVGGSTSTLGTGSALIGNEVAAARFVKAGATPARFESRGALLTIRSCRPRLDYVFVISGVSIAK